jgi:hypothetical protein
MDNGAPVLKSKLEANGIYKSPSITEQRDSDHEYYSKLTEERDKRIQVLESSLADVKNQVEQVRKETFNEVYTNLLKWFKVSSWNQNYHGAYVIPRIEFDTYIEACKSK